MIRATAAVTAVLASMFLMTGCNSEAPEGARSSGAAVADISPERVKDFGSYELHFNAITTDQLPADVASSYRIARSNSRAMLNVVVIRKVEGTTGEPVKAAVTAKTTNLVGQPKNLSLREIEETGAVYYIGDLSVSHKETLIFDISATPEGGTEALTHKFKQQFFTK